MKEKKLLVVEALSSGAVNLLRSAKKMGFRTLVATHKEVYENDYGAATRALIDEPVFVDLRDEDGAVAALVEYAAREGVCGVVAGFEFTASIAVKVAARLGLPSHDPALCDAARRKDLMHAAFQAAGVPCARTRVVNTWPDCVQMAEELGFPLVMKPSAQAGSVNVFGIHSAEQLEKAFAQISRETREFPHGIELCRNVLLQEYLTGEEVSVELAVVDGDSFVLAVTDKMTTTGDFFAETGHTLPSGKSARQKKEIVDAAKKACRAVGLRNGVAHVEVMLTAEGAKVIEVGARLPGDNIVDLLDIALGIDQAALYIQIATGQRPEIVERRSGFAAIRFINSSQAGWVRAYQGIKEARAAAGVRSLDLYVPLDGEAKPPTNNLNRLGHLIAEATSYERVCASAERALKTLRVTIEPASPQLLNSRGSK